MSFFFAKERAKPAVRGATPVKAGNASKETLNRLGCRACPLDRSNNLTLKMKPDLGITPADIYFLGEGVSEGDDKKGVPLNDKAGQLLKSFIKDSDAHSFDNVIRDYFDTGAKGSPASWVPMECCRPLIVKSIEQAKPKLIVGLGILPLQWMMGSADMVGLRGRLFAVKIGTHACWFMPTYSPQFVIEKAYDKSQPLRSKLGHCLKFDVAYAEKLISSNLKPPTIDTPQAARAGVQAFTGHGSTQLAQVLKLISEARRAPEKAIDIETSKLRPYAAGAKVLTAAVSIRGLDFAFAIDHPKAGWKPDEKKQVKAALSDLLSDATRIISHNASFEIEWLAMLLGKEVIFHDSWECTMMQAHFLDERRGKRGGNDDQFQPNPYQALNFLVKQHFGLSYKPLFKLDIKNMEKADLMETLLYNGADTRYTLRLFLQQKARLELEGLWEAYQEARQRQPAVALMQVLGIDLDRATNTAMQNQLAGEIKPIQTQIMSLPVVQSFVKDRGEFNPASNTDVIRIFKDYIKVGNALKNEEGKESVDKGTLSKIDHPLAKLIEPFRNRSKLKSTYVDVFEYGKGDFIWPDGKLHPSFNTTFSETGRTSCTANWTPVVTTRGEIPIRDVCVGDRVWTHEGRWKPVTRLWRKGWEVMLNLKLSNGSILTCTKNHRLLSANGQWVTAGEIYGVFQEVGCKRQQPTQCSGTLPKQGDVISATNCTGTPNYGFQCLVGHKKLPEQGRVCDPETTAVLNVKDRQQEPNEGVDWGESSPMEGGNRRRAWVQNNKGEWQKNILSSLRDNAGIWTSENPERLGNSSHRRGPTQQFFGQFSNRHSKRSSRNTSTPTSGFEIIEIEEIEIGRSCEVFDITVADDASYLTAGVVSHNSDEPNQQNWPSRNDKWVRKQIYALKGYQLVAFDFGQLEGCTAAMCTKDKALVKALWEDYDIHMEWAVKAAHRYPAAIGGIHNLKDAEVMEKFRGVIKNKLVFPVMFGAANDSVAGYLNMPIEPVNKLMNEFWQTFSGLHNWQKQLMSFYYENGYVESPTKRRRRYPLSKNQAINYPIQSVACDIVCRAMVTLSERAAATGNWYLHPIMNIHDDLTFCIPDDPRILESAIEEIYKVMLTQVYDFINVPLSVSCSIGSNWLEMDKIGRFWSHKDL